jgi:hypothetical protein
MEMNTNFYPKILHEGILAHWIAKFLISNFQFQITNQTIWASNGRKSVSENALTMPLIPYFFSFIFYALSKSIGQGTKKTIRQNGFIRKVLI